MQHESTHTRAGWRNSSAGTRFERLAWAEERRYACQRNVQYSTNTLSALRELRQRTPPGFFSSVSCSLAFLLSPPPSLSSSFGCGNSSRNIKTIQSSGTEMKAPESVYNCFPRGATIPIEPSWLPVPSSGSVHDKETRKIPLRHGDHDYCERTEKPSPPPERSWNYKRLIRCRPFHPFWGTCIHVASFWAYTRGGYRGGGLGAGGEAFSHWLSLYLPIFNKIGDYT